MSKINRIDLYLNRGSGEKYVNTAKENELVAKFVALYTQAKSVHDKCEDVKPENLEKWRKAYYGTLNALDKDGNETKRKSKPLRKMIYELIESKVDNSVPMPKMQPRYKRDLPLVDITENYLKFEADRILTKYINDQSERSTYIDGTSWYKVWWDSLDNTHERSGDAKIELCTADQIIPQPGVKDYRQLEYIFERKKLSVARIYDLYGKLLNPISGEDEIATVSCYYLNEDRIVGLFMWSEADNVVICNEKDWQIRKLRTCKICGAVNPAAKICGNCGSDKFKFTNATTEILDVDLHEIYNPYDEGETEDVREQEHYEDRIFLTAGTEIPFYQINQLPFVPRPAISSLDTIYGISEVRTLLENQDATNKILSKSLDKTLKSGAVVTKPEKLRIGDTDETFKLFGVRTAEEAQMVQAKQILADTSQDIVIAQLLYDSAKAASGVTDSFQGKRDTTATSGKAKELAAAQSAGRIESLRVMKAAAFAGVYELLLKYLLAFSDETRKFVKVLPDGQKKELSWNKYMFLAKDKYGAIYYRDDFSFSTDPAATLSQNRAQMWQETQDKFISGAFGNPQDPRVLKLFWNIMDSFQYPLAKLALAGIEESEMHLPPDIEQALLQNPQLLQMAVALIEEQNAGTGQGGARPNSGPKGNGATHAANVERTNQRNRANNRKVSITAQQGGQVK